jgi:hypothetical protein
MSDRSQQLIALLKATATVTKHAANRFHEDHVPQLKGTLTEPFVWLSQRQETPGNTIDGAQGEEPDSVIFDVEISGGSMRRIGQKALAAAVRSLLHNYRSSSAPLITKGIFVRDKENDHIPVSNGGDKGVLVTAFDVEVWA